MADTVDLPADARIKQLAHDVVREDSDYAVPLLLDFYDVLRELDEEESATIDDLTVKDPDSDVHKSAWMDVIELLQANGIVEEEFGGRKKSYLLSGSEESES
jgi:hypothetical protein